MLMIISLGVTTARQPSTPKARLLRLSWLPSCLTLGFHGAWPSAVVTVSPRRPKSNSSVVNMIVAYTRDYLYCNIERLCEESQRLVTFFMASLHRDASTSVQRYAIRAEIGVCQSATVTREDASSSTVGMTIPEKRYCIGDGAVPNLDMRKLTKVIATR